jgi:MFS superfamily sulfate permease-like transporter
MQWWHLNPVVAGAITEPGIVIYRFGAPLFYANANPFSEEVRNAGRFSAQTIALVDRRCRGYH